MHLTMQPRAGDLASVSASSGLCLRPLQCQRYRTHTHRRAHRILAAAEKKEQSAASAQKDRPQVLTSADSDDCSVFVAPDGNIQEVMCCDYGFRSGFGRLYQGGDGEIPKNALALGWDNFRKEAKQLRRSFRFNEYKDIRAQNPPRNFFTKFLSSINKQIVRGLAAADLKLEEAGLLPSVEQEKLPEDITDDDGNLLNDCAEVRTKLRRLQLDNNGVYKREQAREASPGYPNAPWFIRLAYFMLCYVLDVIYDKRPVQRFWFLEVVARMPYFSYISMLHLYESLGWWRAGAALRKIHFAEEWNELHHLQIMESLGGDQYWIDRFAAQHAAVFYYWVLVFFFAFSPELAYVFSELVEGHATDTYDEFIVENKDLLSSLPPPLVALEYYKSGDLYMFDSLQTTGTDPKRRPSCNTLYDVFHNIADDEREHVKTMKACRDYSIVSDIAQRKLTGNGSNNMTPDFSESNGESNGSGKALGKPTQKTGIKQMDTSEMS